MYNCIISQPSAIDKHFYTLDLRVDLCYKLCGQERSDFSEK